MKTRDLARESVRDWLVEVMERTGLSAGKMARAAQVSPSTIYRALDPDSSFVTTVTTLSRISEATGVALPHGLLSGQAAYSPPGFNTTELSEVEDATSKGGKSNQSAYKIESRTLELEGYLPGDVVIIDMTVKPVPGDIVCAQIFNFNRGSADVVLRLYDAPYLTGRAMDRNIQPKPVLIDNERVVIIGTVTRMIRDRQAA